MSRPVLEPAQISPVALNKMAAFHPGVLDSVQRAIRDNPVVVVGMGGNAFVKRARTLLKDAGVPAHYVEYGNYVSKWRERLAIKMWSGWPTFPQVFVRGTLLGGADQTAAALSDGSLRAMLEERS